MSKVPAHYELIPKILQFRDQCSPSTKLIINGDIKNLTDIQRLREDLGLVEGSNNSMEDLSLFRAVLRGIFRWSADTRLRV